ILRHCRQPVPIIFALPATLRMASLLPRLTRRWQCQNFHLSRPGSTLVLQGMSATLQICRQPRLVVD
ncbi:hypothetical protein BGW38_009878, partial [Lunasporangiospora selenospora]